MALICLCPVRYLGEATKKGEGVTSWPAFRENGFRPNARRRRHDVEVPSPPLCLFLSLSLSRAVALSLEEKFVHAYYAYEMALLAHKTRDNPLLQPIRFRARNRAVNEERGHDMRASDDIKLNSIIIIINVTRGTVVCLGDTDSGHVPPMYM